MKGLRLGLDLLRRLIRFALLAVVILLLARYGLEFRHPAKWDALWPVVHLQRFGDPVLKEFGNWLGFPWSPASRSLLPVGLAAGLWLVRIALGRVFETADRALEAARRTAEARAAERAARERALAHGSAASAAARPLAPAPIAPPPTVTPPAAAAGPGEAEGTGTIVAPAPARRPDRVGRYEILEELGRGAMGVVYKARDPQIGRTVAIKTILSAKLADESVERYKRRFYVEAQAAGKLAHPGIVTIHDIAEDQAGQPCLVMEFIEGTTLEKLVGAERLPLGKILDLVGQVARALDYAHARGVIHRDIKPANIMVTGDDRAKVSDFGIAKLEGTQLTTTGQIIGTPAFMSPEQFMGAAVDPRSDIFSLGSVLYWLCTGERPFPAETITAIAFKVVHTAAVPARQVNPTLPNELDFILSRCLAKSPDERYPSAGALAGDLESLRSGRASGEGGTDGVRDVAPGGR